MTDLDPAWSLTDDALMLILHAESDIGERKAPGRSLIGMRTDLLGGNITGESWLQETAVLRLVSTVESYANAASRLFFSLKSLPLPWAPFTWPQRIKYYKDEHSIDLEMLAGWPQVKAGIELRNSAVHGLGSLTQLQLSDGALGDQMKSLDVRVGGGRMHPTVTTIPKLADGCRQLVRHIEKKLVELL